MEYENLLDTIYNKELTLIEAKTPSGIDGLLIDKVIIINKNLDSVSKKCILAEEYAHFHLTSGDILDQRDMAKRKQEKKARKFAYELLLPFSELLSAFEQGITNIFDLADFFEVTIEFMASAIEHYQQKHGMYFLERVKALSTIW